ncbi:MAG: polyprenyl synthetase family protein [Chloroflexi bacterium]|nr:polyprenyl synthetase family protein [Chloroflexota bacterium]
MDALRQEARLSVTRHCQKPAHRDAMLRALGRPGLVLHPEAPCHTGALCLHAFEAVSGPPTRQAVRGAAAVELLMDSAYMFDHLADQDVGIELASTDAEELSLAVSLMVCAFAAASEAAQQQGPRNRAFKALNRLFRTSLQSCAGQFMDASLERSPLTRMDQALSMTSLKAGSLGRLAAEFGASLAGAGSTTIRVLGDFGLNLFTYAQLVDDMRDVCPERGLPGDLARHKQTVPVVFFCRSLLQSPVKSGGVRHHAELERDRASTGRQFEASGARVFCAVVAEVFLNRAKASLLGLGARGVEVRRLEDFLGSVVDQPAVAVAV